MSLLPWPVAHLASAICVPQILAFFIYYVLQVPHFSHLHQFFICDVVSPGYAEYRPQTPAVEYVKSVGDASRLFPGFARIDCGWQDNGLVYI